MTAGTTVSTLQAAKRQLLTWQTTLANCTQVLEVIQWRNLARAFTIGPPGDIENAPPK